MKLKQYAFTGLLVIFMVWLVTMNYVQTQKLAQNSFSTATTSQIEQTPIATTTIVLSIDHGVTNRSLTVPATASVLDALVLLNTKDEALQLKKKTYNGLGTLIESMYGYENGTENKYWQYTVNNVAPQIGAADFVPNDGDIIVWSFTKFTTNN